MKALLLLARRLRRETRSSTAVLFAVMIVPFVLFTGVATDFARLATYRSELQSIVDSAALSGASAYTDPTAAAAAQTVAANYVGNAASALAGSFAVASTTAVAGAGTTNLGQAAYNVTVSATANVAMTLLSIDWRTLPITVTATASNPLAQPTISLKNWSFSAWDWNRVYAYPVPYVNGEPSYATIPPVSQMYEIGSTNSNFQPPANQVFPAIAANQPIAFALQNVTGGDQQYYYQQCNGVALLYGAVCAGAATNIYTDACGNPLPNAYGSISGAGNNTGQTANNNTNPANWLYSALLAIGQSPSALTNYTYTYTGYAGAAQMSDGEQVAPCASQPGPVTVSTSYPTTTNCAFVAQQVDPANLPTSPPVSGSCYSLTDPSTGYQYATLSCAQMAGNTYYIWWNDMGGPRGDDKDYRNGQFTISCAFGGGGALTQVVLTR